MRLAAISLSILAVLSAAPLLAETPAPSAPAVSSQPATAPAAIGDTVADGATALPITSILPIAPIETAKKKGQTCPSEQSFLIELLNQDCSGCPQACEDQGGTFVTSLFDRLNCYCICCAA